MSNAARPSGRLLAQGVLALTQKLVRAVRDCAPADTVHEMMQERQQLLRRLARKMDDPASVGSLAALEAAVSESDRTLGALLG